MKPVRLTKAEAAGVREALALWSSPWGSAKKFVQGIVASVNAKLDKAEAPEPSGVAAGPLEKVLIEAARGKIVQLVGNNGTYGRASRMATLVGATHEDARVLGTWIAGQR